MKFIKTKDYNDMSRKAANIISAQVILDSYSVLGLATGSTPVNTYQQLIDWYKKGDVDFSQVCSVNLDEYRGLDKENEQSYYYYMYHNLFQSINIQHDNILIPNGTAADIKKECSDYDKIISLLGGIDLQLLGIGHNGHIGFNEPTESFAKGTHCVDLSQSTIDANARFFENESEVPKQAITVGVQTIMLAKKILVIVSGEDKADIVANSLFGPITPKVPASILQMHQDVTIVGDEAALSKITL